MRSPRDRAIDGLADLAIRVCVGGGFLLGVLAGMQGHPRAADCADGEPCVGEHFLPAVLSVAVPAAAGAFTGLVLALLVVRGLRRLRAR